MPEWNPRANDIFVRAVEIDAPADRRLFLEQQCGGDAALQLQVESLLAACGKIGSFLEKPAMPAPPPGDATAAYRPLTEGPGTVIGPYKLLQHIGEGGFGAVYMAEQEHPVRRKVALKIIKLGMDTREVIARFESERQALAMMEHPNIARVFDAGATESGRPYFVMELVRGVPITEFCDKNRFSAEQRLKLFVTVCNAIQHAHHKGIIHRDVKPSNVMVTLHDGVPVVKVIDFGVAKATAQKLTERTLFTAYGQMIGTPAYMSPEQAEMSGLDIDMRSDIFSLGVLLYELLTGTTPLDSVQLRKAGYAEMQRLIREEEAPRPSTRFSSMGGEATVLATNRGTDAKRLSQLLRSDLDWIVMKSLDKDRNRRYGSPANFAADIERYLKDEAVEACPPTLGYRLGKAYRRNKAAVWVATIFSVILLAAAVVSVGFGVMAKRAEVDAVAARNGETEQRKHATRQRDETAAALAKLELAQERQAADQYVWDMQLLPLAFEANNVAEVNRLLDRQVPPRGQPDRRGFEWYYWYGQLHTDLRTERLSDVGDRGGVWVVSPDGSRIARFTTLTTAPEPPAFSPAIKVWDVTTRKVLFEHQLPNQAEKNQRFTGSPPSTNAPVFSRDGKRIVMEWGFFTRDKANPGQSAGRQVRQVLDTGSGKVLLTLKDDQGGSGPGADGAVNAAFSPDGRRFAAVCHVSGKLTVDGRNSPVHVRVWDVDGGTELCPPLDADALAESPFSPDGTLLVTRKSQQGTARVSVWKVDGSGERAGWEVPEGLSGLAFSPDGAHVAGVTAPVSPAAKVPNPPAAPQLVKVWTVVGKDRLTEPFAARPRGEFGPQHVYFSPDGARLAVEGYSESGLTVWDVETVRPLPSPVGWDGFSRRRSIFSPDGRQIVSASRNVLRVWDVGTGKPLQTLRGHATPVVARAFSSDGKRIWSWEASGVFKEWDARSAGPVAIQLPRGTQLGLISGVGVSRDGSRVTTLATPPADRPSSLSVHVWDPNGKRVTTLVSPPRGPDPAALPSPTVNLLAISGDGRRAVLTRSALSPRAAKDGVAPVLPDLTVWDVQTGAVSLHQQLQGSRQAFAAISPDGRTVAVTSRDAAEPVTIRVFDVDGRRERTPLAESEGWSVLGLDFSPDGRRLAVYCRNVNVPAGELPARVIIWDTEASSRLCVVDTGRVRPGQSVRFGPQIGWAPDASRFALAHDHDGKHVVTVYDAANGRTIATMDQPLGEVAGPTSTPCVAYSPDGRRIAAYLSTGDSSGTPVLKVWDAASGRELLVVRGTTNRQPGGERQTFIGERLTFAGDGHRLQLVESISVLGSGRRKDENPGGWPVPDQSLLLTTWGATPRPELKK